MPRGDNPNSRANLRPLNTKTIRQQREVQRKGGLASSEVRREQASLTAALKEAVTPEVAQELSKMIIKRAKSGNLKAYELIRDGLGEKPIERVMVADIDEATITEVDAYVHEQG